MTGRPPGAAPGSVSGVDAAAGPADDEVRRHEQLRGAEIAFRTDLGGCWTYLDDTWTRVLGYPVDESIGTLYESMMHPADRPASLARLAALLSGEKEECRAVFRMFHRDRSVRWLEIVAHPLHDDAHQVSGMAGTLTDVTDVTGEVAADGGS